MPYAPASAPDDLNASTSTSCADEGEPVGRRHIDLTRRRSRGVQHTKSRQITQIHRLSCHGEHAGDHGLRCDDGCSRGEHDQWDEQPRRSQQIERIAHRIRILQHQRALSEIVQRQRRQHELQPPVSDRDSTEVTEIGVERLTAGDHQKHRGEHDERLQAVARKELDGAQRIQRREDVRHLHDLHEAEHAKRHEPDDDDRSEHSAHSFGALTLHGEQRCEYDDRDRHDKRARAPAPPPSHLQPRSAPRWQA